MRIALFIIVGVALSALILSELPAQEGAAERIGRRIDQGLDELTEEVRQAWSEARKSIDRLGVQGRVYGRLRWDKALADQPIDVDVEEKSTVILTGGVPNEMARKKAIRLAEETVGVREVVDRLQIEPHPQVEEPAAAPATSDAGN